jgi:uncharacterized cupredoxin-like copper-binding protein
MSPIKNSVAAVAFVGALATMGLAAPGYPALAHDPGHSAPASHGAGFSAGEPGDPKKPVRTVPVTMKEGDGKMLFIPDRLEIRRGEQIRFVLTNTGLLEHEFILASTEENLRHAEDMKAHSHMTHDDPNERRVAPSKKSEIVWQFTKAGTSEYGCLIPGHREAGMTGTIIVK